MNKLIFVIGAGGHAKVLIDTLHATKLPIKNILERNRDLIGKTILNETILFEDVLKEYRPDEVVLVNGVGSISYAKVRAEIFNRYKKERYHFLSIIHPTTYIAEDVKYGEGLQVMAGCVIQPGCCIGNNVIINTKTSIDHDCIIGDHVHLGPGVTLSGGVEVGRNSHLGTGSTVIQNITIGNECLIAAGAVVIHSVSAYSKVGGVPARELERERA